MSTAARAAHGGDVIDVDAKADCGRRHVSLVRNYPFTRSASATTFFARSCEMIEADA